MLNLDAENELFATTYTPPSARSLARLPDLVRALAPLFGPDDVILGEGDGDTCTPGIYAGRAWCPTPSALARLAAAGAVPVRAPALAILRRVNHRRFCADLGEQLPGARYVTRIDELAEVIAGETPTGDWLLKRPFGFAGRGRRKVTRGPLDPSAQTWVASSLREGDGLQVEPWVERSGDFALHGYVSRKSEITLGEPTQQECNETGVWQRSSRETDLDPGERAALTSSALASGEALAGAGYFGPFGVDAFRFHHGDRLAFNARCEINARYSMGWAIGMGALRPDLDAS